MLQTASKTFLRTQSDSRLATLAAGGNEVAFAAIVERHGKLLKRACRRVLPESRVEDAVQQAFMAAWTALRRGDEVRDLRPWLLRIARNTALNALRAPGYDYDLLRDSLQAGEAPPAELERREIIRSTLAGLAALPDGQREALLGSAVHGTPHAELARELGVSEGAVRQLVLRARTALRAAATAVVPLPVVKWLAAAGQHGEPTTARVAELAAGAAPVGAGLAALLAKGGTIAVIAGGAAVTPSFVGGSERDRGPSPPAVERVQAPGSLAAAAGAPAPAGLGEPARKPTSAGDDDHDGDDGDERADRDRDDDDEGRPARRRPARESDDDDAPEPVDTKPVATVQAEELEEPEAAAPTVAGADEPDSPPAARPPAAPAAVAPAAAPPAVAPDELAEPVETD